MTLLDGRLCGFGGISEPLKIVLTVDRILLIFATYIKLLFENNIITKRNFSIVNFYFVSKIKQLRKKRILIDFLRENRDYY